MIAKSVVAGLSLLCVSATDSLPATTQWGIPAETHPEIVQVRCFFGSGTAFYVGPRTLVSVDHVTRLTPCRAGGQTFEVVATKGDFSILRVATPVKRWLQVDCGGFVIGNGYVARGYARGLPTLTEVDLVATGRTEGGASILMGVFTVIPGQSGGPIINPDGGAVVGTINTYDARGGRSGSVELKGTSLCSA